jgi:ComF family protein
MEQGECPACRANHYAFTAARSWAIYKGELRRAILSLKHRRNTALGLALSENLATLFAQLDWHVDMVIPIPLSAKKKNHRGYNQVDLMAVPFAVAAKLPLVGELLVRRHETLPQFELSATERWANLRDSFAAKRSAQLLGMRVLLVDDIMTSGATLDAAAQALRDAGVQEVYCLTLARALFEGT